MAGGALKSLKVWVPIFGVVVLAFFYFLVNFGAAKSPVANTRGLPVAVVNGDTGAKLGGERVELGSRVVKSATTSEKIGSAVEWTRLGSRGAAVRGISRGEYDGALIIPKNYSQSIANLAAPPELPVAIVNEDEGAKIGGKPVDFGGQVVEGATSEKKLRGVLHWSKVSGEKQAFEGFSKGEYAAIVIPKDYSGRLASLAAPTAGKTPEPAQLLLLTNPATDPSTLSTVKQAFSGFTASTSRATGEKLSGALASANVSVPAGQAPLLGNPVRGKVEAAHLSGGTKAPEMIGTESARVEILTNQSAGPFPSGTVQAILSKVAQNGICRVLGEDGPPQDEMPRFASTWNTLGTYSYCLTAFSSRHSGSFTPRFRRSPKGRQSRTLPRVPARS